MQHKQGNKTQPRTLMMMEEPISSETPFILKHIEVDENFIRLPYEPATVVSVSKEYLERQILRSKIKRALNVDNYIMHMKQCEKLVPFYMTVHNYKKITYLTSQNFSLGLLKAAPGTRHEIKNVAYSVPLYVFVCSVAKQSMFANHANNGLALVNKTWIESFFHIKKVMSMETLRVPNDSVYFFFAMSHSKFTLERIDSISDSKPEIETKAAKTGEINTEETKEMETDRMKEVKIDKMEDMKEGHKDFNSSKALLNTLKKVEKLDSEIVELEMANRKLEEANQELKRENSILRNNLNCIRKRLADVDYEVQNSKK